MQDDNQSINQNSESVPSGSPFNATSSSSSSSPTPPTPPQSPLTPQPVPQPHTAGPDQTPNGPGEKPHESVRSIISTVGILLLAPIIAILLTAFVFQSYQVEGPSMETTLQNNDRLIVWKMPRTWARITGHQYVPNRGDVVIFNQSGLADLGAGSDRQLIKRVIGLPGERVEVSNGVITVFNKEHPEGFQPDQTLPYNKDDVIPETSGELSVVLGDNQIFVSGDNRPESLDSRNFGPVDLDQVVGKLVLRMLPANNIKTF